MTTIDEDALRAEVTDLMPGFIKDYDEVVRTRAPALPHMLEMHERVWRADVGLQRFLGRTQ